VWVEVLEERVVLSTNELIGGHAVLISGPTAPGNAAAGGLQQALAPGNRGLDAVDVDTFPAVPGAGASPGGGAGAAGAAATGQSIPALSSLPGAPASLYLDFAGDSVARWLTYSNISIPAFDTDGDGAPLSQAEVDAITGIWQIVAENYAPFNINVTTVDPRTIPGYAGGVSQIDIGGDGSWSGGTYGGYSQVGGITGSTASNPARGFVFPANLGNGAVWYTGEAASHEAGHTMGLQHQSSYSGTTKTAEYQQGPGDGTAPIMGNSYYVSRGMWWYGTSSAGSTTYQNDPAVIASNSFGYRPLATGSTVSTAAPLGENAGQISGAGVIESMSEVDMWSFTTDAGAVSLSVAAPSYGNLHPKIEVLDAAGNVVAGWTDSDAGGASWSGTLAAGSYRLVVASHGVSNLATSNNFGFDIGSYSITGTVVTPVNYVAAPSNLTASAVGTSQINLAWTNNATNATDVLVEQSTDNGKTFTPIADLPPGSTSYAITSGLAQGTTYTFRVRAFNASAGAYSDYSNQAGAKLTQTVPAAPSNFTAAAVATSRIHLSWTDNSNNETGFAIERATYNSKNGKLGGWSQIATVGANVTAYDDTGVASSGSYAYRIRSFNSAGDSAYVNASPGTVAVGSTGGNSKGNGSPKSGSAVDAGLVVNMPSGPLIPGNLGSLGAAGRLTAPDSHPSGPFASILVPGKPAPFRVQVGMELLLRRASEWPGRWILGRAGRRSG
jgi:hypothetical protein